MMVIEKFLGQRVTIPEDRRYWPLQGLWAKQREQTIVIGFSQPALILIGGIKDLDRLVEEGQSVQAGETVAIAITGKILYIDSPIAGVVQFNGTVLDDLNLIGEDPYDAGWLFEIRPGKDVSQAYRVLETAQQYVESLKMTEGFKNPEGLKGGVSGICKAVYTGIGQQKF